MRARNGVLLGLALLGAAIAGWWFGSPWWTLRQMREAARAHDSAKLSAYVDYPALRADLKREVAAQMLGPAGVDSAGPIGRLVAATIAGPLIDAAVSPEGVQAMFDAEPAQPAAGARPEVAGNKLPRLPSAEDRPVIERRGVDQFSVHARETGSATMNFRRHGLGWKLSGIELPPPAGS